MDGLPFYALLKEFSAIKCYQKFLKKLLTLISWSHLINLLLTDVFTHQFVPILYNSKNNKNQLNYFVVICIILFYKCSNFVANAFFYCDNFILSAVFGIVNM